MRGQAHTLEGVVAALVLLTGVLVAMQMAVVTPLSASTSSQFIENQQQSEARGVLANAAETGWLKKSVLYWDDESDRYHDDENNDGYTSADPIPSENQFGQQLEETFGEEGIAYNVYFVFQDGTSQTYHSFIYQGVPSDKAVAASRTVTIMDEDHIVDKNGEDQVETIENTGPPDIENTDVDSPVYKVVSVKVITWRN